MESLVGPSGEERSGKGGGKRGDGFVGNGNLQQPLGTGVPLTWPAHKQTRREKRASVAAPDRQPAASLPAGISRSAAGGGSAPRAWRSRDGPRRSHRPAAPTRGMRPHGAPRALRPPRSDPPRPSAPSAPQHRARRLRLGTVPECRSPRALRTSARSPRVLSGATRRCPSAERLGEAGRVRSPLPCPRGAARVLAPPRGPSRRRGFARSEARGRARCRPTRPPRTARRRHRPQPPSGLRRSAGNDGVRPRCGSAALRRVVRVGAQTGLEGLRRRAPHAAGIVPIAPCSIAAHPQKESAPVGLIPVF